MQTGAAALGVALTPQLAKAQQPTDQPLKLWYRQPAEAWTEALPVGNGRLGAMVFGGVARERLQLNEDTLWAGGPYDPAQPGCARGAAGGAARWSFEGKYLEAQNARARAHDGAADPADVVSDGRRSHADVSARRRFAEGYRRELDLDTAVATTSAIASDGVTFTREVFASPVDQVIVIRLSGRAAQGRWLSAAF